MREQQHAKIICDTLTKICNVHCVKLPDIKPDPNQMYTTTKPCDVILIFKFGFAAYIEFKMINSLNEDTIKMLRPSQKDGVIIAKKLNTPYIIIGILKQDSNYLKITDAINDMSVLISSKKNYKLIIDFIIQTRSRLLS